MKCLACQHENRDAAKFCEECAAPLPRACSACGADLRPTAKFCDECGIPLAAGEKGDRYELTQRVNSYLSPISGAGARKTVTIIFADLAGSTALHERLDAESARLFMEGYYRAMRGAVERHGGAVAKLLGDGVMAVFGLPLVAEDDAIRAVRAAVDMQRVFRELAEWHSNLVGKVGLRVAVNTGEVVAKDETELIGDPVNVAARLQDQARDGDVVIGETTRRLVSTLVTLEPLGSLALKGRAEAVHAYRVVSLERPASATTAAFVGRDDELARLMAVHDAATRTPAARLTVLLGSPGLGKSRLIGEFVRRAGDKAGVITGHCDTAGGTSFAPVTQALRRYLGIDDGATPESVRSTVDAAVTGDDADRARIVDGITALLSGSPASPEETFFVVRRFLAALAATRPVVLVIDDLHWAEPLLLDLVEHLVQWGAGVPLFVLVGARPELRDTRSSLTTSGGVVADVVTLAGLDAGAAMRLAANMLGAADLPAAIAAKVLASSEGNPLFVGELVRMLVHEGALQREGDRWTVGVALAALEMPPTIHALLAARIERLRPEDRAVLERAAVVGRHFSRSAVIALLPRDVQDIDARLESLRRSELIEPDTGWFLGEPVLRFHHLLIRDAAYRRLLKGTRAELHGRLADWIEARTGDAVEQDETLGWHLEQAYLHLRELGPLDERGRETGAKASRHLAAAGRRALARDDLSLAAGLLGRALPCLEAADPARADLALDWCEALLAAGDVTTAAAAIAELDRFTTDSPRLGAWHTCFAGQLTALTAPQSLHDTADAVAAAAEELAALGDDAGEAKAHAVHAQTLARLGRVGACEAALDRALAAARKAGDRRRANAVLAGAPVAALWGPSPVTRASGRCLDVVRVLRITQGAPAVEAVALSCQGVLEALRGRTDAARRMIALSRKMVEELGISHRLYEADVFAGRIELLEGDAAAAERGLRASYEGLRELGLGIDAARAAALLARALLALGRVEEAEALSHESELLAGDDLQAAIAWRGVRAEALARRGEHAAAVELAKASVAIAAATDALLDHADARLALAAALRASGRTVEADAEEKRAIELWEAKGATLLAERARGNTAIAGAPSTEPVAAGPNSPATPGRRVHENAATRSFAALAAAVSARDFDAAGDVFAEDFRVFHHPTGVTYDRTAILADFERERQISGFSLEAVALAGLGETLALGRQVFRGGGVEPNESVSFGEFEIENYSVTEVDGVGRRLRTEVFAADHLDHAIVRLYELHAERVPEGPGRVRAEAMARAVGSLLGENRAWSGLAPDIVADDRRHSGSGKLFGRAALIESFVAMTALASDLVYRIDDIVHLDEHVLSTIGTHYGTDKLGGGAFERPLCIVWAFREDGLLHRWDTFEPEDSAAFVARIHELLPAGAAPTPPARRHVRPNAATRNVERFAAAFCANNIDATAALYADDVVNVHHVTGISFDKAAMVESWKSFGSGSNPSCVAEPVASLGDTLCLARQLVRLDGILRSDSTSVGPIEHEMFLVVEVDDQGRRRRNELFAVDHFGNAITGLYEIRAESLPEGPERERAAATARTVRWMLQETHDLEGLAATLAPDLAFEDHRRTGTGRLVGAATVLENLEAFEHLATGMLWRYDDILHLGESSLVVCGTNTGKDIRSGGDFERRFTFLWTFGPDGRLTRMEVFEPEDAAKALARIDELVPPVAATGPMPRRVRRNAAYDATARLVAAFAAADQAALASSFLDSLVVVDHPNGATYGRDGMLDSLKRLLRSRDPSMRADTIATLGESLHLACRWVFASGASGGNFDVGPYEKQEFVIFESSDGARVSRIEIFARNRLGHALHRLYELHADSHAPGRERERAAATARSMAAMGRQQMTIDELAAGWSPTIRFTDHRKLGLPSGHGADKLRPGFDALFRMLDETTARFDAVLRAEPQGNLTRTCICGIDRASGGTVEFPAINLCIFGDDGLLSHYEAFEPESEAEALSRFDELLGSRTVRAQEPGESGPGADILPWTPWDNAASRTLRRMLARWATGQWEEWEFQLTVEFRYSDRRRLSQLELDRDEFARFSRDLASMASIRVESSLLATRGERLALARIRLEVASDDVGPSEIEHLNVVELNADGAATAFVRLDLDDVDAAFAELESRFRADEATIRSRSWATLDRYAVARDARDWEALAAQFHPDLVTTDHRMLGWGTLEGREAFVRTQKALIDLAPDTRYHAHHIRTSGNGIVASLVISGTRDGGTYELPNISVQEVDGQGLICRVDIFESEDHEKALARFRSIDGPVVSEVSAALPEPGAGHPELPRNAATRTHAKLIKTHAARDWDGMRGLAGDDFHFEDRGKRVLVSGDVETWLKSMQFVVSHPGVRFEHEYLAALGDRILLGRLSWIGESPEAEFLTDKLRLIEVAEDGRLRRIILFDYDDRASAFAEALDRFAAGEAGGAGGPTAYAAFSRHLLGFDWEAMASALAPEFVFDDRRPLSLGILGGDEWVASLRVQADMAPDLASEVTHVLAWNRHGFVASLRTYGNLRDGGPFENLFLCVFLACGDRLTHVEPHPVDAHREALARFEELCAATDGDSRPATAALPPNSAEMAANRFFEALRCGDDDGAAALVAPGFRYQDRGRRAMLEGDVRTWIDSIRFLTTRSRTRFEQLAAIGDRLLISRITWTGRADGPELELDRISLLECDDAGRLCRVTLFDIEDRAEAWREAEDRFAAEEAAGSDGAATWARFGRTLMRRDWDAAHEILSPALRFHDHRPLSFGVLDGEQWLESIRVQAGMAPDIAFELLRVLAWNSRGVLVAVRSYGNLRDGGPFENVLLSIFLASEGRLTDVEPFPVDAHVEALARFEELTKDPDAAAPKKGTGTI